MPYKVKGKCIYKRDGGAKVGCTNGDVNKYLAALHANANESTEISLDEVRLLVRKTLSKLTEAKEEKLDAGDEIHLPELTMNKNYLIKYLKDVYDIKIEE